MPDQDSRTPSQGVCQLGRTLCDRWRSAWREIAAATIAAIVAWVVAQHLFDHPHPIFAAVIAIVALGPGIPSHRKQAWGLVLGVAVGILVGEVVRFIPEPAVAMGVGVFVSMMIATSFGMGPVVPIQAGVSLLLVLTLGTQTAGYVRMIDVVIGAVVGLICGRLLLRPKQ
ncbi:FUSC family protein [Candidimonas nitroreducens]|nr:FUSC family protein [Candidimonas nitroreducens]